MKAAAAILAFGVATAAVAQPLPAPERNITLYNNAPVNYVQVSIGTTSTTILPATPWRRVVLDIWNVSGRASGTATDAWCMFGVPAVIGQGFPLIGDGGEIYKVSPAAIDSSGVNCIAATLVTVTVGSVQQ